MAELDNIPQKQTVELTVVKLDEKTLNTITELNQKTTALVQDFGNIYIRKKELHEELDRLEEILKTGEEEFKASNQEMRNFLDELDELYPQGRINLQEGTITYQVGAPSRKKLQEQQLQQANSMKVVKD